MAPSTGAMALHKPVNPWLFNVRATYQRESERAVQHLSLIGIHRIGVVHVDDSFGADVLEGAQKGFATVSKTPLFIEKFDRAKPDFSRIAPLVASSGAQAVLFIGSGAAVADGIAAIRKAGSRAQILTNSNNASGGFIKSLGANAAGTIVTQVLPNERSLAAAIVKEAGDLAKAKGVEGLSPAMLEGFAAAKVLVAGLQRAIWRASGWGPRAAGLPPAPWRRQNPPAWPGCRPFGALGLRQVRASLTMVPASERSLGKHLRDDHAARAVAQRLDEAGRGVVRQRDDLRASSRPRGSPSCRRPPPCPSR